MHGVQIGAELVSRRADLRLLKKRGREYRIFNMFSSPKKPENDHMLPYRQIVPMDFSSKRRPHCIRRTESSLLSGTHIG